MQYNDVICVLFKFKFEKKKLHNFTFCAWSPISEMLNLVVFLINIMTQSLVSNGA